MNPESTLRYTLFWLGRYADRNVRFDYPTLVLPAMIHRREVRA